jgi:signal transduction histidine kinase
MLAASSGAGAITSRSTTLRGMLARRRRAWADSTSRRFVAVTALGVGLISFLATELMHYLLVPDLGRHHERLLAEGMSAFVLACVVAKLANIHRLQCRRTAVRMQVISEMNHHIRNALTPISLSADVMENQQLSRVISEAVDHIDWALREILPRETPLREESRREFGHFQTQRSGSK